MSRCVFLLAALPLLVSPPSRGDDGGRVTLVAWAPGYPGSTEQAQPSMDAFARHVARAAGWGEDRLGAVYFETLQGGLERLSRGDVRLTLVTLPIYLSYRERFELRPLLQVVPESGAAERWSLVVRRGAIRDADGLRDWELVGMAGYAPEFVRRVALAGWGELPASVEIGFSSRVLGSLRKAAAGDPVAVLLDGAQTAALESLPFAEELEVVARSAPLPGSLLCAIGGAPAGLVDALVGLHETEAGREVLAEIRLRRFEPFDARALGELERAFAASPADPG